MAVINLNAVREREEAPGGSYCTLFCNKNPHPVDEARRKASILADAGAMALAARCTTRSEQIEAYISVNFGAAA